MNIVLFDEVELESEIQMSDRRIHHIKKVLKIKEGETFDAGIINKSIGKAYYTHTKDSLVKLSYSKESNTPVTLNPVSLIIGIIRPVNIQRTIRDLCTLGVKALHFVVSEKSEKSYAHSKAYDISRIRNYLIEGAEQAFNPYLPEVYIHECLTDAFPFFEEYQKIAFDNYEFSNSIGKVKVSKCDTVLALGPERGWSNKERQKLREHNFSMLSLGERVLRTETACTVATSVLLSKFEII
ncbi:16S rRNA (uracil(1498)-N(3))-methyltransferase [Chondrinema litorale]|uniref:16S rRNA (uracil(1498)-N(3))-methyltransferase n=1 Tax=Chondrinema litorale TaxID=2994555 RepID=UPI002543A213|nr:RsmE family RNA methyltransferase [Chondrinema litorale]UZR93315.1 RsmE family RNA methyltransferase [Chondrinema litorale]